MTKSKKGIMQLSLMISCTITHTHIHLLIPSPALSRRSCPLVEITLHSLMYYEKFASATFPEVWDSGSTVRLYGLFTPSRVIWPVGKFLAIVYLNYNFRK
jgi:hypothetical protein